MKFWFAHSSSHSDTYVQVAQFGDEKVARQALKALKAYVEQVDKENATDWGKDDAHCYTSGSRLYFSVYTAGSGLDEATDIIQKSGGNIVAEGTYLYSVAFTVRKPTWNEVKATQAVVNLLHKRLLDPELYMDAKTRKRSTRSGCVWTLEGITDWYDEDEDTVRDEPLDQLRQLGIDVSIESL